MNFEGQFTQESPRHERFCLRDMPLDVSNRFQARLAAVEYARYHNSDIDVTPGNTVMLWWITKGFARAYGDYVVSHERDEIDVDDENAIEDVLAELEASVTIH
jgi:hypothetical protein